MGFFARCWVGSIFCRRGGVVMGVVGRRRRGSRSGGGIGVGGNRDGGG